MTSLLSVPFFHATGCFAILNPMLFGGAKLVMMHRWDVVRAFELIERERVTMAGGVPTIAWQLIEHPLRGNYDLSSLQSVAYGGAPSAPELVRKIKETFPKSSAGQGWGMTETSATATGNSAEDYEAKPELLRAARAGHRPEDHDRRGRPRTADRRGRRALVPRAAGCARVLEQAGSHRPDLRRRLGEDR